jgi:peptide/nickel transport system permease protein
VKGRRDPAVIIAGSVLAIFVLLALLAPLIAPYGPSQQLDIVALQNQPPSWRHPLGTDLYSRDILSRLLFGARVSLGVGLLAAAVALVVGALVGALAGYFRKSVDAVLMWLVNVGLAVPRIFLVLVIIAVGYRPGALPLALLLGLTGWFTTSRLVRAEVLSLRERPFVEAARGLGVPAWQVIARHLLPNTRATLVVSAALAVANMMLLEASLSFLGVGVQPPSASWGNMIADARHHLLAAPWTALVPGLAIAAVVMALHVLADALSVAAPPQAGRFGDQHHQRIG